MPRRIVTLTTDFGTSGSYVAQMKGVLLGIHPEVEIVDITHEIAPQNVRQGALVLADLPACFPPGTIHVAVVDPGVGTERRLVYVHANDQHFLAPDNGLLSLVVERTGQVKAFELTNQAYWRMPVSLTFHGRDILAPVAAHLSLGVDPRLLGNPLSELVSLDWPEATFDDGRCVGEVLTVDRFGNLITNITRARLESAARPDLARIEVQIAGRVIAGLSRTYGEHAPGALAALFGSSDRLEIAVVNGNAAEELGATPGDMVSVCWPGRGK